MSDRVMEHRKAKGNSVVVVTKGIYMNTVHTWATYTHEQDPSNKKGTQNKKHINTPTKPRSTLMHTVCLSQLGACSKGNYHNDTQTCKHPIHNVDVHLANMLCIGVLDVKWREKALGVVVCVG